MDYLDHYGIPIHGLHFGVHHFKFEVDESFFKCFEDAPIQRGKFLVDIECDKRENQFLLTFNIDGHFEAACDRCLADIDVDSGISKLIWVKYKQEGVDQDQLDEDYFYIEETEHIFNVASLIYEFIVLSIPIVKRYDCENDPNPKCDKKVLAYLDQQTLNEEEEKGNSFAEALKKLKDL